MKKKTKENKGQDMKKSRARSFIELFLTLAVICLFGYFGYTTMTGSGIKLGLDLAGGVSITYQAKGDTAPSAENMADTVYKLQQRVQNYSTEAQVYQEGDNRINIDIPGVSDANAILEELGKPGSLVFLDSEGNKVLDGTQVTSAQAGIDDSNGKTDYVVALTFDEAGTKTFADATAKSIGKPIYIVYDEAIVSSPVVQTEITGGHCSITGMESYEKAQNLAATIRIGSLSVELEEIRSNVVGAQLGQNAIRTSLLAGAIGFAAVALFMIAFYWIPGLAASLALCLYVAVTIVLLSAFEITMTLPGIAGIILSIGMAVDANCIIFTRIREEIGLGHPVAAAIKEGFRKALSAIIDGNITTLIASAVLYKLGSGSVKGFATTLALGILVSMITALFVTRFILWAFYGLGFQDAKWFGVKKEREPIHFIQHRKTFLAVSAALIVAGFAFMGYNHTQGRNALNYSMEFLGGTSTNVAFNEDMTLEQLDEKVQPVVQEVTGDANIQMQKVAGTNEVIIKTRTLNGEEREKLNTKLADSFGVDKEKITAESISGTVSSEMRRDAVVATVVATVLMLIYIWVRFKNITFAASSVLCLIHDVLITLAAYAALRWSVGNTFIACMLTIVGYSINATIVIFDRIRENKKLGTRGMTIEYMINKSVTQTLSRSINTSLTTFAMVLILYLLGVSSIREFSAPLMVGIVSGTWSSVLIASALWYIFNQKKAVKDEEFLTEVREETPQAPITTGKKKAAKKSAEEKAAQSQAALERGKALKAERARILEEAKAEEEEEKRAEMQALIQKTMQISALKEAGQDPFAAKNDTPDAE